MVLGILVLMMGAGCNRAAERGGARAQTLLAEVELLNESRKFDKAQETLEEVFSILDELNQKDPSNLDFIFMRSKAYMLRFLSLNTQIIEKADIRKRSLVRMPEMHEYEGYDENIEALQALLIKVLNSERELTLSNRGFIHGMLAASYRLSDEKTNEAITQYGLAIKAYQTQLKKLKEMDRNDFSKEGKKVTKTDMKDDLKKDMKDDLKKGMKDDLKKGMKDDLKKGMKGDLKKGMKEDIKRGMKDDLKKDMKEDIKRGMKDDLKKDMKEDIKKDIKEEHKKEKNRDKKKKEKNKR